MAGHLKRAQVRTNPNWYRLSDLTVAFAGPNGHAEFGPGELRHFLGVKDSRTVTKAIAEAVAFGALGDGSHTRCLRLPVPWEPFLGGGTTSEQNRKRTAPCPSCDEQPDPAQCHPSRKRYTSVENGSLCQQCWRERRAVCIPLSSLEDDADALASLVMMDPPDELATG